MLTTFRVGRGAIFHISDDGSATTSATTVASINESTVSCYHSLAFDGRSIGMVCTHVDGEQLKTFRPLIRALYHYLSRRLGGPDVDRDARAAVT